jgi:phage/plasmid-like protein (TIGR03299 family)
MPANVETMFSVKETPWHGIGKVIVNAPTIEQGIIDAGLAWDTLVESLYRKIESDDNSITIEEQDEFARVFVRSDNRKTLGIVGPNTHPLQNVKAFDFFEPFVASGEAFLETAGSLDEGRKVWVMAKINRDNSVIVKGDEVAKFVLLSNSHDGTTAVRVGFTPVRVVCANTLAMAHKDKASKLLRVRHSKQVEQNLEHIREAMNLANEEFEATAEQFRFLASRQINAKDLREYVKIVFKMEPDDSKISTRSNNILADIIKRHDEKQSIVLELLAKAKEEKELRQAEAVSMLDAAIEATTQNFESGRGTENANSRGTYWTAYNAINEYLNYDRGHNKDTRLNSLWFGQNATANNLALDVATKLANG